MSQIWQIYLCATLPVQRARQRGKRRPLGSRWKKSENGVDKGLGAAATRPTTRHDVSLKQRQPLTPIIWLLKALLPLYVTRFYPLIEIGPILFSSVIFSNLPHPEPHKRDQIVSLVDQATPLHCRIYHTCRLQMFNLLPLQSHLVTQFPCHPPVTVTLSPSAMPQDELLGWTNKNSSPPKKRVFSTLARNAYLGLPQP